MTLILHMHPLSSYCMKVLIAFYENGVPHEKAEVNFGDPASAAAFRALAPMSHMPVLEDNARGLVLPESSVIIEYLGQHYVGPVPLVPRDKDEALTARLWDRFSDNFVMTPMQKIVTDNLRPEDSHDPYGVNSARETLRRAYAVLDERVADKTWVAGDDFTIADCALSPALWYADKVEPLAAHKSLSAYLKRLVARHSFARAIEEAQPFMRFFPA